MTPYDQIDRRLGMFLGLAIGDALGAAVEFKPRGSFPSVTHYRAGGPWQLAAGEWTDDTSMALALADSIVSVGWDLHDQAQRYLKWRDAGHYSVNGRCFDIGNTTHAALSRFAAHGDPLSSGLTDERSSGNGSLMRLAPISCAYFHLRTSQPKTFVRYAMESSRVTHASRLCLAACAWMALALCDLAHGSPLEDILSPSWIGRSQLEEVISIPQALEPIIVGQGLRQDATTVQSSGFVLHSLDAALWAVAGAKDFESAVLRAVNLGDDADTIGAIAGQLAGAIWGLSSIPQQFTEDLAQLPMLADVAEKLVRKHPAAV